MNKIFLLANIALSFLVSAQQNNHELNQQLENRKNEVQAEFDFYLQNQHSLSDNNSSQKNTNQLQKNLLSKRNKIAFFFQGQPYFLKKFDTDQIKNSNSDALQKGTISGLNQSFNGKGVQISVFDGGRVYEKHLAFEKNNITRVTNKEDSTMEYDAHATAVTSIIGGEGYNLYDKNRNLVGNSQGIATLATFDSYSFENSKLAGENTEKDVLQKLLNSSAYLSNHSYGINNGWEYQEASNENIGTGWYWNGIYNPQNKQSQNLYGTYLSYDKGYDDIVYNNPHMIVVKAAGNSYGDGPYGNSDKKFYISGNTYVEFSSSDTIPENNCAKGYDCIGTGSLAKNIIIVGANNDQRYTQTTDVIKADYSSAGPRDDGAIKPDIAGVGNNILHASTSATGSNDWKMGNGTSYSSPQITGIIGLWIEMYKSLFSNQTLNAASAKNLLIHSAQEAGNHNGPDVLFGWGFADAKKGAELLVDKSNNKIIFEDKTLNNLSTNMFYVESNGTEPLKASVSWIDPSYKNISTSGNNAYDNRASRLINDLDLRITNLSTNEVFYPWKLDANNPLAAASQGDNTVDNTEQVWIEKPSKGIYKVEVSHKGNLVNNNGTVSSQNYSIITTGYQRIVPESEITSAKFSIYPTSLTETENIVHLKFSENIDRVSVYDMAGRLLKLEKPNTSSHTINFGAYTQGVYIIRVNFTSNTPPVSQKVMKR